jgi:hypothetical protein
MKTFKPLLGLLLLVWIFSCQKEKSYEKNAAGFSSGSLQSAATGDCLGNAVSGTYKKDTILNASNYVDVQVDVSKTGSYTISTDTINGFYFRGAGSFTATGMTSVRLLGNGKPIAGGTNIFTVTYDSSQCTFSVVTTDSGTGGPPATYSLAGSPNACTGATVQGTYTTGVSLTTSNTATVQVNVTAVGTYSIATTAVGGMTFTGSGTFSSTGVQSVVLLGSGTPTTAGANVITISVGNASCTFTVNVTQGVANTDLFPLTTNSWWSYDDVDGLFVNAGDSLKRMDINTLVYTGNNLAYNVFQEQDNTTPFDSFYYRRSGNDYFELNVADLYSTFSFDSLVVGDINFLKEGLAVNQSWTSAEFSGKMNNSPAKLQYAYTCTAASTTATINGNNFNNVYKISWKPRINLNNTGYVDEPGTSYESWYAKGVGLIYFKATLSSGTATINIKHWQVF